MSFDGIYLSSIGGYDFHKKEAGKIINFFKNYDSFIKQGASLPRGIIFYGEPGTGKTMFAHAIANESNVPLIELESKDLGSLDGISSVISNVFEKAKACAPSIILIDEIDRMVPAEFMPQPSDKQREALRSLLVEMDKLKDSGVLVIATSNSEVDSLSSALTRNGRIEKHYYVSTPTKIDREEILRLFIMNNSYFQDINISDIAAYTPRFSAIDLKTVVNDVIINCVNDKRNATFEDILDSIAAVRMHTGKNEQPKSNSHVVIHEIGHFVADYVLNGRIGMINTSPYGAVGGTYSRVFSDDSEEAPSSSKTDMLNDAIVAVSGVVATELFFGEPYAGAASDYSVARKNYKIMCANGLMSSIELAYVLARDDSEVAKHFAVFCDMIKERSKEILSNNRELIQAIYDAMQDKTILSKDELEVIASGYSRKIPESLVKTGDGMPHITESAYASSNQ